MTPDAILIVDDEESICKLCQIGLETPATAAEWTTDARAALQKLEEKNYSLLLTDIKMPQMSGIELMHQAKRINPEMAVIVMTAYASVDTAIRAVQEGASDFIHKPFHLDELKLSVSRVLESQRLVRENIRLKSIVNLIEFSQKINTVHDPQKLYSLVIETALQETGARVGKIFEVDEKTHNLKVEYEYSLDASGPDKDGLVSNLVSENLEEEFTQILSSTGSENTLMASTVAVPLRTKNRFKGILSLYNKENEPFSRADFDVASILANQAAIALENTELLQDLERLFLETIKSLATTLDEKDPYTHGHSLRVSQISVEIGERMGFSAEQKEILSLAGSLHDIGKIGIPDSILQKPGKLTKEEYEIIKTHPEKGAKILRHIQRLEPVVEAVYTHHEWYNGKGYPRGLQGEEIPVTGAIVNVADALDT
ncbi:MAG TPA: response regulator, partial [Bacteroidetes bacterium]|nr:response regulator [Bacteroidota bacterium]